MNNRSLFQTLREQLPNLTESFKVIADSLLKYPEKVLQMSIVEFARQTRVSPSTVFEFAKRLGFSGFKDLKIALARELQLFQSMRLEEEKLSTVAKNFVSFVFENIQGSFSLIEKQCIEKTALTLLNSSVVEILSYGFDAIAGKDLFLKLKQLGFLVNFYDNPFLQSISTANLPEKSSVVAISSSHSSTDMLDAVMFAKQAKATVLGIAPPSSKIAEVCDVFIPCYLQTEVFPEGGVLTKYLQLFVVDTIVITMIELEREEMIRRYNRFEQVLYHKRRKRGDKGVF